MSRPTTLSRTVRIRAFITEYIAKHHYPPTRREIACHLGVSTSVVQHHLNILEADGVIGCASHAARGIWLVAEGESA